MPADHGVGIVHLGLGAFHKAHQAVYLDEVLARDGGDWRIIGVSCRSSTARDQLRSQEYLYSVVERDAVGGRTRIIGSIASALVAPENPAAVTATMAKASTHLITVTVTEKGYCRSAADGLLDLQHEDIVHDLVHLEQPRSAPGLLTAALRRRRRDGAPAPTILCCDNLPLNGETLRQSLLRFASHKEPELAAWIDKAVAFPSTMVDRIVPATTEEDVQQAESAIGIRDEALVKTEPFSQWVIEDRFAGPRPALERAGVLLVADVRPFELAKLRLLNGTHSALAYLGLLSGHTFVHEAIADAHLRALLRRLMSAEVAPTLPSVPGLNLADYQETLLNRLANPMLQHRLSQIAMDGSQKIPQRLIQPLVERLMRHQQVDILALAAAAWIRYALGRDEHGERYQVDDPLAPKFLAIMATAGSDPQTVIGGFLGLSEVFGSVLSTHDDFRQMLTRRLEQLIRLGVRETVHRVMQTPNA